MKLKSPKQKGARLERFIAQAFRSAGLDKKATRMPLSGAMEGHKSDISTSLPFTIEAKNQESWSPLAYMEQASRDASVTNKIPIVVMSKNRLPDPMVMMKFSDWVLILQRAFIENKLPITTGANAYSKHKQLNSK